MTHFDFWLTETAPFWKLEAIDLILRVQGDVDTIKKKKQGSVNSI